MPLFMDVHTIDDGVAIGDVAKAHLADLQEQAAHDVSYLRYWVDEGQGKIFCLVEAPSSTRRPPSTARRTVSSRTRSTRSRRGRDEAAHPGRRGRCSGGRHAVAPRRHPPVRTRASPP